MIGSPTFSFFQASNGKSRNVVLAIGIYRGKVEMLSEKSWKSEENKYT
jgi:hypothetical protein